MLHCYLIIAEASNEFHPEWILPITKFHAPVQKS